MSVMTVTNRRVRALGRRVAVKVWEPEKVTKSGIVIPETAQERPQVGEVISVGPQVKCGVKEGDEVVIANYAGTDVKLPDKTVTVLSEDDILMVLDESEGAAVHKLQEAARADG